MRRKRVEFEAHKTLFAVAQYLDATPNEAFAEECRKALFEAEGDVVKFPATPDNAMS